MTSTSQPISDNAEEAVSGGKGLIAVKVFAATYMSHGETLLRQIDKILGTVEGIEDLGVIRNIG